MADKHGVFIRSDKDVGLIIKGCEELLKSVNGDLTCIKTVNAEDNPKGFEVYFKNDSVIAAFLKKKYLPLTEELASIHTLTTKLVVHKIGPDSVEYLKEALYSQLEELGDILDISNIPVSKDYPTIQSGDWLVEINKPEVLEMDIFKKSGLPNEMSIQIFSGKDHPLYKKVTFFCSLCENKRHPRESCPALEGPSIDQFRNFPESEYESDSSPLASRSSFKFEIRDREQKSSASPTSKSAKQKHRIEAIASGLERKKTQTQSVLQSYYPSNSTEIKREREEESFHSNPCTVLKRPRNGNESGNNCKKFRFATVLQNQSPNEQDRPEDYSTASSTTGRESPEILYDSLLTTPENPKESLSFKNKIYNYHDDPSVPNVPTSSQPEHIYENSTSNSAVPEATDDSDSNDIDRTTKTITKGTRKKPTYAPVVLPDRIRQIVLERGTREGELSVSQLEAFFNHVKKKMSPAKIARQFTPDVQCLQEQLKSIVQQYYMTPKAGSGEDSRFMKWLEGMLDRFDSVPSKRKKIKSE